MQANRQQAEGTLQTKCFLFRQVCASCGTGRGMKTFLKLDLGFQMCLLVYLMMVCDGRSKNMSQSREQQKKRNRNQMTEFESLVKSNQLANIRFIQPNS